MREYFGGIWAARYFWIHLAASDLRSRWRKSFFGFLWCILQPLGVTVILAVVLGKLFHTDIRTYAPYIISGMLVWDFLMAVSVGGSLSFVQADAYIKYFRHPLAIYSLRTVVANLVVLAIASVSMYAWAALVRPDLISIRWLSALSIYPLVALVAWPMSTLLAYAGSRFRDLPNVLTLLMQAIWFVSPVYFEVSMFRHGGLDKLVDYNPLYHLLQIVRAPLLEGKWPSAVDYEFCLGTVLFFTCCAWLVGRKVEKKIIFYL